MVKKIWISLYLEIQQRKEKHMKNIIKQVFQHTQLDIAGFFVGWVLNHLCHLICHMSIISSNIIQCIWSVMIISLVTRIRTISVESHAGRTTPGSEAHHLTLLLVEIRLCYFGGVDRWVSQVSETARHWKKQWPGDSKWPFLSPSWRSLKL